MWSHSLWLCTELSELSKLAHPRELTTPLRSGATACHIGYLFILQNNFFVDHHCKTSPEFSVTSKTVEISELSAGCVVSCGQFLPSTIHHHQEHLFHVNRLLKRVTVIFTKNCF